MLETFTCTSCGQALQIPETHRGKLVRCPGCKNTFTAGNVPQGNETIATDPFAAPVPAGMGAEARLPPPLRPRRDLADDVRERIDRPKASSGNALLLGMGLSILVITVAIGAVVYFRQRGERVLPIAEAPPRDVAGDADQLAGELKPLFTGLGEAFWRADRNAILANFDLERMADELSAHEESIAKLRHQLGFMEGLRDGFGRGIEKQAPLLAWHGSEIRTVRKLGRNELVVIVRHQADNGATLKMRWWLLRHGTGWKVFDFEDLDMGLRASVLMASVAAPGMDRARLDQLTRAVGDIREAAVSLQQQDLDAAERSVQRGGRVKLPRHAESVRLLMKGLIQFRRRHYQEALKTWDQAAALNPDMPALDLYRGMVYNDLHDGDRALRHLEAYRDLLGEDSQVCYEIGVAQSWLGQFPAAQNSYRKALDYNPKNADALLGLARALGLNEPRDELGERFAKLDSRDANFDVLADDRRKERDGAGLVVLSRAMLRFDPDSPAAQYCLAIGLAWTGKSAEALPVLLAVLPRPVSEARRDAYLADVLPNLSGTGKILELYQAMPDKLAAFRALARELKRSYQPDELRRLIRAHEKQHPLDPRLFCHKAALLAADGLYARADKMFAEGAAGLADQDALDLFRYDRVQARYHTGQALSALVEIGPLQETLRQLANNCLQDQKLDLLETLLGRAANPESVDVLTFKFRLRIRQNRFGDGIELYQRALQKPMSDPERTQLTTAFLYAMVDAGKALEGYRAAPDARAAFQILGADLNRADPSELKRLLEEHRSKHADDSWLNLFTAEVLAREKAWEKLEQLLAGKKDAFPADRMFRVRQLRVLALCKLGRHLKAYADVEPRTETYTQLVDHMLRDRKTAQLEELLAEHRRQGGAEFELLFQEARCKVLANKPDEACTLFLKAMEQTPHLTRLHYASLFVADMYRIGRGLQAYQTAPDAMAAFQNLANRMAADRKVDELAELIKQHGKKHAGDIQLAYQKAQWLLLRGEAVQAEAEFRAGLAKAPPAQEWQFRIGIQRAAVKNGKTVELYREQGPSLRVFESLAFDCISDKNAQQLEELIAAHRQQEPDDDATIRAFTVDLHWLRKDFDAVLKLLEMHEVSSRYRWKHDRYHVYCLAKLGRPKEALKEAERLVKSAQSSYMIVILAHAVSGDVKQTIDAVAKQHWDRYLVGDCYRDPVLGDILRSEAFLEFRQRYPHHGDDFPPERFDDD